MTLTTKYGYQTFRIGYNDGIGSAILISIEGKSFLFTAKHIVTNLQRGDNIKIRHSKDWFPLSIEDRHDCPRNRDLTALRVKAFDSQGLDVNLTSSVTIFGQQILYLGFPLNFEIDVANLKHKFPYPLVKSGVFSGSVNDGDRTEFLFDTINNKGFSGGPILTLDANDNKYKVIGIVSGYKYDTPINIIKKTDEGDLEELQNYYIRPNSGFMVGVPISNLIKQISSNS